MDSGERPLLSTGDQEGPTPEQGTNYDNDIDPINGVEDFVKKFLIESKKLWRLAGPTILLYLCQYSLGAITQVFAGQVGVLDLAAFAYENLVIAGFSSGILYGMGSAVETLCGQAFGAGRVDMLGVYLQRSWIILLATSLVLCFLYIFAEQLLKFLGESDEIAKAAGDFAPWMLPQLFAYALNYPISKFLQSQRKMMVMCYISAVALILHTVFSWLLMLKLGWGLVGAAVVLNVSWWFIVVAQLLYILSGSCGRAWSGLSWEAFHNLWEFLKLSIASAVMLSLEVWYLAILIVFAGYVKTNEEVSVDAMSVCMNILAWALMVFLGFNAGISVRVSNELGASHPRSTKFSIVVAMITSLSTAFVLALIPIIFAKQYPSWFSTDALVKELVYKLTPLLAISVVNNVQPVLSGVAVGAGWQTLVAYVNIGCNYIFGIPLGLVLGLKLGLGVEGIWSGMLSGTMIQTCILFIIIYRTDWNKEASVSGDRIRKWGGDTASAENDVEK